MAGKHNIQSWTLAGSSGCQVREWLGTGPLAESWATRLAAKTVKGPSCWLYTGCLTGSLGYGQLGGKRRDGRQVRVYAHRLAWELAHQRPVPEGLTVLHRCDEPACVNPSHLTVGTQGENVRDSVCKGRYNCFGRQKLNAVQVLEIRRRAARGDTHRAIAQDFEIRRQTVSGIVNGHSWGHLKEPLQAEPRPSEGLAAVLNLPDSPFEFVRSVALDVRGEVA